MLPSLLLLQERLLAFGSGNAMRILLLAGTSPSDDPLTASTAVQLAGAEVLVVGLGLDATAQATWAQVASTPAKLVVAASQDVATVLAAADAAAAKCCTPGGRGWLGWLHCCALSLAAIAAVQHAGWQSHPRKHCSKRPGERAEPWPCCVGECQTRVAHVIVL